MQITPPKNKISKATRKKQNGLLVKSDFSSATLTTISQEESISN